MSERVKQLTPLVLTLKQLKPKQRRMLLEQCLKNHMCGFEELALNIVKNTAPLSASQVEVCRKWKKPLRLLALRNYPIKAEREILQRGGFFAAFLSIMGSGLRGLLNG